MRPDVLTIHRFYETPLGVQTAQLLAEKITGYLPPATNGLTVGLGYCLPYFDYMVERQAATSSERFLALMPAQQGVCHWPTTQASCSCLVDPYHLPLSDSAAERVILVHALEQATKPASLLREVWRVLAPGGQVVIVVPNRLRTWSNAEATPFGHGRPYSKRQLMTLMGEQMLPPDRWSTVLMQPPFTWPGATKLIRSSEKIIGKLGKNLGGALVMVARKQVYGAMPKGKAKPNTMPVFTHMQ
ncbi:MAG: hypothetical protein COB37_09750 [Kordiimonadales bacterium]|nr:MAG: hypothetical protein COB37_09750 [Kordiimonadales bacterium]